MKYILAVTLLCLTYCEGFAAFRFHKPALQWHPRSEQTTLPAPDDHGRRLRRPPAGPVHPMPTARGSWWTGGALAVAGILAFAAGLIVAGDDFVVGLMLAVGGVALLGAGLLVALIDTLIYLKHRKRTRIQR